MFNRLVSSTQRSTSSITLGLASTKRGLAEGRPRRERSGCPRDRWHAINPSSGFALYSIETFRAGDVGASSAFAFFSASYDSRCRRTAKMSSDSVDRKNFEITCHAQKVRTQVCFRSEPAPSVCAQRRSRSRRLRHLSGSRCGRKPKLIAAVGAVSVPDATVERARSSASCFRAPVPIFHYATRSRSQHL